jgi:hypothetical protein
MRSQKTDVLVHVTVHPRCKRFNHHINHRLFKWYPTLFKETHFRTLQIVSYRDSPSLTNILYHIWQCHFDLRGGIKLNSDNICIPQMVDRPEFWIRWNACFRRWNSPLLDLRVSITRGIRSKTQVPSEDKSYRFECELQERQRNETKTALIPVYDRSIWTTLQYS